MARISSVILIVGLLAAVGWVARHDSAADKAGAEITGEWVVAHQARRRRALHPPHRESTRLNSPPLFPPTPLFRPVVGWAARPDSAADKAGAEIPGEWVVAHQAELRRALNLPGLVELEFKEVGQSSAPDYRLLKFELVAGERRRPLQLYVSHDGRRLLYDRVYELDAPFRANREKINEENAPARGPAEAPVTIVEYSDYTCGYCRQFFEKMEGPLFEPYGDP